MTMIDYIEDKLASITYTFTTEQAQTATGLSKANLKAGLRRLSAVGKVKMVRQGFYMIIPPQYIHYGAIPLPFYIDDLMLSMSRQYYVGLYSAAKVYGASHQKIMQEFVVTEGPNMRDIDRGIIRINFLTAKHWSAANVQRRKSDTGGYLISSPALTAFDLVSYQSRIGGYSIIYTVLEELLESIKLSDITTLLSWYDNRSMIQRMGYLFETLGADKEILNAIEKKLSKEKTYQIDLRNDGPKDRFSYSKKWKVNINVHLESDL